MLTHRAYDSLVFEDSIGPTIQGTEDDGRVLHVFDESGTHVQAARCAKYPEGASSNRNHDEIDVPTGIDRFGKSSLNAHLGEVSYIETYERLVVGANRHAPSGPTVRNGETGLRNCRPHYFDALLAQGALLELVELVLLSGSGHVQRLSKEAGTAGRGQVTCKASSAKVASQTYEDPRGEGEFSNETRRKRRQ